MVPIMENNKNKFRRLILTTLIVGYVPAAHAAGTADLSAWSGGLDDCKNAITSSPQRIKITRTTVHRALLQK